MIRCGIGALATALAFLFLSLLAPGSFSASPIEDNQLSVYAPQAVYTIKIVDRGKVEYVGLYELLQPLAPAKFKVEGDTAKLRVNKLDGHFTDGSDKAKIGREYIQLAAPAVLDGDKRELLIPMESVPEVLSRYIKAQLDFHVSARRLFIDNTAGIFSAQMTNPSAARAAGTAAPSEEGTLRLAFPFRVGPRITVEGNKMRLRFTREPVISSAEKIPFDDKLISSVTYAENNGSAEVVVNGKSPLLASFADQGKTIVISAAPRPPSVAQNPSLPPAAPAADAATMAPASMQPEIKPKASGPSPLAAALAAATPHYFVIIDASHGGSEPGARFSDKLLEKDITLSLARHLRTELQNRGVQAVLLRDGDTTMSFEQRALAANTQRASLYISIHAGASGSGVHFYTAFMSSAHTESKTNHPSLFLPWQSANLPYLEGSRLLANAMAREMESKKIRAVAMTAPVPPLNRIAATAVVIELGPQGNDSEELTDSGYQEVVAKAAAAAIISTRSKVEETSVR